MENESENSINVFGREIKIFNPKAYITTISKTPIIPLHKTQEDLFDGKEVVFLCKKNQFGAELQIPILTREFNKSADEFIDEFEKRNAEYTNQ
jgi:hypothetical protein